MQTASILTWLLVSTMTLANAETRCKPATKEQACQRRANGHETEDDHERALLTRKAKLDVYTQGVSTKEVVKHNLLEGASQKMFSRSNGPIVDVKVIASSAPHCGEGWTHVSLCGSLNCDLNQGAGGYDIWLCFKKGNNNDEPITDLRIEAFKNEKTDCSSANWHRITQVSGSNGNLNQGAGGNFIYLCYQKDKDKDPLDELALTDGACENGMFAAQTNRRSNGDLNQKAGGKDIYLCVRRAQRICEATETVGTWAWKKQIVTETEWAYETGSAKTEASTKTEEWSKSVSATVEAGFEYPGGTSGSVSVTGELARQAAQEDSESWEKNEVESVTITFPAEDVGKDIWQFQYQVTDGCSNEVTAKTLHLAKKTGGKESPPCCLPGYCNPPDGSCTKCLSPKARIPNQPTCGEDIRCVCSGGSGGNAFVCTDSSTNQCSGSKSCYLQSSEPWVWDMRELGCQ